MMQYEIERIIKKYDDKFVSFLSSKIFQYYYIIFRVIIRKIMFSSPFTKENNDTYFRNYIESQLKNTNVNGSFHHKLPIKAINRREQYKRRKSGGGTGKWTMEEQRDYIQFLRDKYDDMSDKYSRKTEKVFLQMSALIKTRSPDQCRSHHQKILKYHHNLRQAIQHFEEQVFPHEDFKIKRRRLAPTADVELQIVEENQFYGIFKRQNFLKIQIQESIVPRY